MSNLHCLLALLVASLTAACGGGDRYYLKGVPQDRRSPIDAAAQDWCSATRGVFCPNIHGSEGDNEIELREKLDCNRLDTDSGCCTIYLSDLGDGLKPSLIQLRPLDDQTLYESALHELGHTGALRTEHLWEGNVMDPERTPGQQITDADVAYVTGGRE